MGHPTRGFRLTAAALLLLGFVFGVAQNHHAAFAAEKPRVFVDASSDNFPPMNLLDGDNRLTGFGPELADAVIREIGGKVTHLHSPYWPRVLGWLESGKADFIHDTGYTSERAKFLDFSDPIIEMPEVIFVRAEQWDITGLASLKGKTVACVDKHITHLYLRNLPDINCRLVKTPVEGVYSLVAGEVDAFVYPKQIALYLIQNLRLQDKVKISGEPLRTLIWSMVVRKGNQDVLNLLNEGLRKVRASGEYERIYEKWWGKRLLAGYSRREVIIVAAIVGCATLLAVLSLGLIFYSRTLKNGKLFLEAEIRERKLVEGQRQRLETQLRQTQKLEAIGTLAGGIAHDFNNILAIMIGYAELIQNDLPRHHPAHNGLEQILKAGDRGRRLVRQIMSFSRSAEDQPQPLNPAPIFKESLKMLRSSIPTTIEIKEDIGDLPDLVRADATKMSQVIINLCANAAQAMEDGGVLEVGLDKVALDEEASRIRPSLKPGDYLRLTVRDTGVGIEEKNLGRIFDPFFTTKEIGKGTGLGLSVVHGILQAHGGAITAKSEVGKGSVFTVYLPIFAGAAPEEAQEAGPLPRGRERILLVDDEPALVEVGRQALETLGYQVSAFTSSAQALEAFRQDPDRFDLVISDYTMPGQTGLALAKELLLIKPSIPIIICTGTSDGITPDKARALGVKELAFKPLNSREIARLIKAALGQAKPE